MMKYHEEKLHASQAIMKRLLTNKYKTTGGNEFFIKTVPPVVQFGMTV